MNIAIFEKLRNLDQPVPVPCRKPTSQELHKVEKEIGVKFPFSYRVFQLEYSDINLPPYELFTLFKDGSRLDMIQNIKEAREIYQLPADLIPFAEDNGNYFCFDASSGAGEYEVKYFDHNGISSESWANFFEWTEKCWIAENI